MSLVSASVYALVSDSVPASNKRTEKSADNPSLVNSLSLEHMSEQIYQEPWQTYQTLLTKEAEFSSMATSQKLWWLVRKAQCENLLYFYEKFTQTVERTTALISDSSPLKVRSMISRFHGLILQRQGGYVKSREYFLKAMTLAEQGDFRHLYVQSKLELAYTYSLAELFETSLEDMQEAYVEAFALNDQFLIAQINEAYGAIYGYMRDNQKSVDYYQKALDTYERLQYKAHIAEAIYGIASTYRYWKKYHKANEFFQLYQQKVSYTPNTNITYFGAYGVGMTYAEQGKCDQAIKIIDHALTLDGLKDFDAELLKRQTSCFIQLNDLGKAQVTLKKVEELFKQLPELLGTAWHLETIKIASELAYAQGNYQKSYQLLADYNERYTQILIDSASSRVSSIRAAMELDRQEVEKALSSQRNKTHWLEIKAKEQKILQHNYFAIFLITLLIIFVVVVVYQYINNKKMARLSVTDGLSGIYNRRYTFNYLDKLIAAIKPEHGALSIIVLDIDDFKTINDTYGHPTGDKVIKQVVKLALQVLRAEDVMGRIGGEEFLCVLPRMELDKGALIAQRMKDAIQQHQFVGEKNEAIAVTVSFGVAQLTDNMTNSKALYSCADKALYDAKNSGKNQVISFQSPT